MEMTQPALHKPLEGQRVAFTGRLASMNRAHAIDLVRRHGGESISSVTAQTSLLVIGQDGWPLQADGRLSNKLRRARLLQRQGRTLAIMPEQTFLEHLGHAIKADGIRGRFSIAQLSELLKVPGQQLRTWKDAGLIRSVDAVDGIDYFDFNQVAGTRALARLITAGVKPERIRLSLKQLGRWLDVRSQLNLLERNGRLLVRLRHKLAEPSGQLQFDFEEPAAAVLFEKPLTADDWFGVGMESEQAGAVADAIHAYRQALALGGPSAVTSFNLANCLYNAGRKEAAAERFHQALESDPTMADAWDNLGTTLAELSRPHDAIAAYRRALQLNGGDPRTLYNLADLLDDLGQRVEAREQWHAFLRVEPQGPYAAYARKRLAK